MQRYWFVLKAKKTLIGCFCNCKFSLVKFAFALRLVIGCCKNKKLTWIRTKPINSHVSSNEVISSLTSIASRCMQEFSSSPFFRSRVFYWLSVSMNSPCSMRIGGKLSIHNGSIMRLRQRLRPGPLQPRLPQPLWQRRSEKPGKPSKISWKHYYML